jgi:hypothetical protein
MRSPSRRSNRQLDELPGCGLVLHSAEALASGIFKSSDVAVLCLSLDDVEIRRRLQADFEACTPDVFDCLESWLTIESFLLGRSLGASNWQLLGRSDRLSVVTSYLLRADLRKRLLAEQWPGDDPMMRLPEPRFVR